MLLKSPENPHGVEIAVRDQIQQAIATDRLKFLAGFFENFYSVDTMEGSRLSDQDLQYGWNTASIASPIATFKCVATWWTDFRKDIAKIDVPTLVIHGIHGRILPIEATGKMLAASIRGSRYVMIPGAPHGLLWTHADKVNAVLIDFLKPTTPAAKRA